MQKLAPMLNRGAGVVLTTSVANVIGMPTASIYAAGKAALRSMARSFASELVAREIRVNAVSPGPVDTGILQNEMSAEAAEAFIAQWVADNPMRRLGTPDEIARAAVFLAFEASYTTGAELAVDGGGPIEGRDRDVFDLLRSGKNVVSSTGPWFVPELRSPEYRRQIEDACREGGTTLMSAGANPDVVVPWLGAALTRMSLDVDHIYLAEIEDFSPNPNLNMMVELLGLGKPAAEFEPWMEEGGYFQQSVLE